MSSAAVIVPPARRADSPPGDLVPGGTWGVLFGIGLIRLGWVVIPFRSFYLAHERGLTTAAVGWVLLAFGAGWALSQPVGGWCADRFGRRAVIMAGAYGSAVSFVAFGAATRLSTLVVSAAAVGLTFDLYRPAVSALLADLTDEATRPKVLASLYLMMNASRAVACVLGGMLAAQQFWLIFAVNVVINAMFAILAAVTLPRHDRRGRPRPRPSWRVALHDRLLVGFTAVTLLFFTIHMQSVVVLPVLMDRFGIDPLTFGLILAVDPVLVVVSQILLQRWLLARPPLLMCAAGVTLTGVGLAITAAGTTAVWFAITTPIWVLGELCFLTVAPGVVASLAPAASRGVYFGLWGLAQGSAALLAPLLANRLALSSLPEDVLWLAGAFAGLVAAGFCMSLHHATGHRRAAAHAHGRTP